MKAWKKAIGIGIAVAAVGFAILTAAAVLIVTQPWVSANLGIEQPASVDPKRLETHTRKLAEEFVPRDWVHTDNLDRAAAYIRTEFAKTGSEVQDQIYEMEGRTYRNVIARFGPESRDPVVVGAHYDAFSELPGADDNASGVAGLIELAHLLSRARLQTRVELVAFTLEEPKTRDGDGLFRSEYGAVMITDTAPNRNRNYHTAGDTPDRLDYGRMAMVVQGVYTAVLDFARQSNRLKD